MTTRTLKRVCSCPSCRARTRREFDVIAAQVFTEEEAVAMARRVAQSYSPYTLQRFLQKDQETPGDD